MLSPHDPAWAQAFEALREVYGRALGRLALRIEHVGSTAVADLWAKPILDIDLVTRGDADFAAVVQALGRLGYVHRGDQGIAQREVFKPAGAPAPLVEPPQAFMAHHLYVCPAGSPELRRHLGFRDALRARPDLRRAYEAMKLALARRAGGDRRLYATLKEQECRAFVERALAAP